MSDRISSWLRLPGIRPTMPTHTCCCGNLVSVLSTHSPLCLSVCQTIHYFASFIYIIFTINYCYKTHTIKHWRSPSKSMCCKKSTSVCYKKNCIEKYIFFINCVHDLDGYILCHAISTDIGEMAYVEKFLRYEVSLLFAPDTCQIRTLGHAHGNRLPVGQGAVGVRVQLITEVFVKNPAVLTPLHS